MLLGSKTIIPLLLVARHPSPRLEVAPDSQLNSGAGIGGAASASDQLERFFFDSAEVYVRSGAGGEGAVGFVGQRPAGGSGGAGGSVYIECTADYNTLAHLQGRASFHADRGNDASDRQAGRKGGDAVVRVPPNCRVVARGKDGEEPVALGTLLHPGERLLVAEGGHGGEGNGEVWRRTRQGNGKSKGAPGGTERKWLDLSMTLVADVGLVGVPNAGKSTLLRTVTRARPKVADYPFTTLIPNLGVCQLDQFGVGGKAMVWLDIPGLIEGAADGKGLGLAFLRHVERCRLLLHLVDGESDDPAAELLAIDNELASYSQTLSRTPQVVVLTKTDLPHVAARAPESLAALKKAAKHGRVISASSHESKNIKKLLQRTRKLLDQMDAKKTNGGGDGDGDGEAERPHAVRTSPPRMRAPSPRMRASTPMMMSEQVNFAEYLRTPNVKIEYCTRCNWMLRSAWMAQELLQTFNGTIAEVSLVPNHLGDGTFEVTLTTEKTGRLGGKTGIEEVLWDRKTEGRFPEAKELKQRVRDVIDPGKDLGHSEASIDPTTGEEEYAPPKTGRRAFSRLLDIITGDRRRRGDTTIRRGEGRGQNKKNE